MTVGSQVPAPELARALFVSSPTWRIGWAYVDPGRRPNPHRGGEPRLVVPSFNEKEVRAQLARNNVAFWVLAVFGLLTGILAAFAALALVLVTIAALDPSWRKSQIEDQGESYPVLAAIF